MANNHIDINALSEALAAKPDSALKFYFDGQAINPGYHVTEIRHAVISSIDCGRKSDTEHWNEITVQLLDGGADTKQEHMTSAKFQAITNAALKSLNADTASNKLFFEFSPGNGAIRKLSIESIAMGGDEISVSLGSEQAVCKPFERAKAALTGGALAANASSGGCCGSPADTSSAKSQSEESNGKGCC